MAVLTVGDILRQWLESDCGPTGNGSSSSFGADKTGDCLSAYLQGHDRGTHRPEGNGEERGTLVLYAFSAFFKGLCLHVQME